MLKSSHWRSGEVVTLRSAKPTCAGSIPAYASSSILPQFYAVEVCYSEK